MSSTESLGRGTWDGRGKSNYLLCHPPCCCQLMMILADVGERFACVRPRITKERDMVTVIRAETEPFPHASLCLAGTDKASSCRSRCSSGRPRASGRKRRRGLQQEGCRIPRLMYVPTLASHGKSLHPKLTSCTQERRASLPAEVHEYKELYFQLMRRVARFSEEVVHVLLCTPCSSIFLPS